MKTTTDSASPLDISVVPVTAGEIVRVKDPARYIVSFAQKIKDRDALVLWVGPTANGMFKGRAKVRFLKRNGRGKEFEEVMYINDLYCHKRDYSESNSAQNPSLTPCCRTGSELGEK